MTPFESEAKWRLLTRRDFTIAFAPELKRGIQLDVPGEQTIASGLNATAIQAQASIRRVSDHISRGLEFEHGTDRKTPRGNVYRPYRLTVDETILAIIVLRASEAFRLCEIDVFLTTDIPGIGRGVTTRAALLFALSDAVRNGGSMAVQFTKDCCGGAVPPGIVDVARGVGVSLGSAAQGAISPDEARQLYLRLTGLSVEARKRALDLSRRGFFSPERLAFLIATGAWPAAEAEMLLLACPYPELLLGAGALPESRYLYSFALAHARTAVLGGIIHRALRYHDRRADDATTVGARSSRTDEGALVIDARPLHLNIRCEVMPATMGWIHGPLSQDRVWELWSADPPALTTHRAGQTILVLPRPRGPQEARLFLAQDIDAAQTAGKAARARAILAYPADFLDLERAERSEALKVAAARGVDIVVCPETIAALDAEADRRLREGRKLRP